MKQKPVLSCEENSKMLECHTAFALPRNKKITNTQPLDLSFSLLFHSPSSRCSIRSGIEYAAAIEDRSYPQFSNFHIILNGRKLDENMVIANAGLIRASIAIYQK